MQIKILKISSDLLSDFLKEPTAENLGKLTQKGMPLDAEVINATFHSVGINGEGKFEGARVLQLVIQSQEFEDIPEGVEVPEMLLTFHRQRA